MAAIDVPSLDVWDALRQTPRSCSCSYQNENGVELERVPVIWLVIQEINYSTKETIANYLKKGYELVENGFDTEKL